MKIPAKGVQNITIRPIQQLNAVSWTHASNNIHFLALLKLKDNLYLLEPLIRINIISVSMGYILLFKKLSNRPFVFPWAMHSAHCVQFYATVLTESQWHVIVI
jgi:hypothetical protein